MGIITETLHHLSYVFVNDSMAHDALTPDGVLVARGKFSIDEEISNLKEVTFLGKLLNGVTSVTKNTLVTVNEGDTRSAVDGILVTGVVGTERLSLGSFDLAQISSLDMVRGDGKSVTLSTSVVSNSKGI